MADPIPEGYISLTEAWAAYVREWPGRPNLDHLVEPFANAELSAFVRLPPSEQNYRLPPASWREQFFSERIFLDDTIAHTKDAPWSLFAGRTPFLEEDGFQKWLAKHCREERLALERQFDPFTEAWWTLPMAVKWIRKRTPDAAREQWDAFRLAAGDESKASIAGMACDDDRSLDAAQELLREAASGSIRLTAQRVADDEIVTIPSNEIPYLSFTFDGSPGYAERLERAKDMGLGPAVYRDLRISFSELERVWPRGTPPIPVKENANAKRAVSVTDLKKGVQRARRFMAERGYSDLTRDEAEKLLVKVFPSSVRTRRRDAAKIINSCEKRRTQRYLTNRNNELEECRQFLEAAT